MLNSKGRPREPASGKFFRPYTARTEGFLRDGGRARRKCERDIAIDRDDGLATPREQGRLTIASIDRMLQLARQRRAVQEAADERRLKERLLTEAERAVQFARDVAASVTLRALGGACASGSKAERPHEREA